MTAHALSGCWFKLVDIKDPTYIMGLVMLPSRAAEHLAGHYMATFYRAHNWPVSLPSRGVDGLPLPAEITQFHITRAADQPDGVHIHGIAPEDLMTQFGLAFLPSAEYLRRSAAAEPTGTAAPEPARPVEPPGRYLEAVRGLP